MKKYSEIKLQLEFFNRKVIKKLRKHPKGDTFIIIYLKMQSLSMESEGIISYKGVGDTFSEEIALTLDEEPENVWYLISFLAKNKLIVHKTDNELFMPKI